MVRLTHDLRDESDQQRRMVQIALPSEGGNARDRPALASDL